MVKSIFNKIKELPQFIIIKIYSYDSTYINYFRINVLNPWKIELNKKKILKELLIFMNSYYNILDRYCTIRNFTGNFINIDYQIPTLVPTLMGGYRNGPALKVDNSKFLSVIFEDLKEYKLEEELD